MVSSVNNIGVVVRVRPLLARENGVGGGSLVEMPEKGKVILKGKTPDQRDQRDRGGDKSYSFDDAIWSFGGENSVDNSSFYGRAGPDLITHFFQGFNVCLLAYGQTGSGKTYTMMGEDDEIGFIPLLVKDILNHKTKLVDEKINCELKLSYMEVYNETVRDLLHEGEDKKWKVREHPETGPYVDNLKEYSLETYDDFVTHLNAGNKNRVTASTSMNNKSSRSHAILNLYLKQTKFKEENEDIGAAETVMVSNIKLVDLAGSERLAKTQVFGQLTRIKEGNLINKSLTVLGRCINVLSRNTTTNANSMIPYRDSILTYILKENLGGNSKTMMIFCVSPLDYEETHQTLNYATRVKQIKTKATVNQTKLSDTKPMVSQSVVESLREEIDVLTNKLNNSESEKLSQMVTYLETELNKSKFQNKYIKNKLTQSEKEIEDLKYHNSYLHNLLLETLHSEHKARTEKSHIHSSQSMNAICDQLHIHNNDMSTYIEEFQPNNVF